MYKILLMAGSQSTLQ
uniref:Uncharacterized protein n=1 Tax=Anguilla anguilla TaxID=7936 RepID=A0A0E9QMJ8_ANGAN